MGQRVVWLFLLLMVTLAGCQPIVSEQKEQKDVTTNHNTQEVHKKAVVVEKTEIHKNAVVVEKTKAHKKNRTNKRIDTSNWIPVKGPARIPILMYHSISTGNSLRVPENEFFAQMKWLKENGYYTLSPDEAYLVLTKDIMPTEKCVLITFDDGYVDNYTTAFPILKQFGMKATIFIIGKAINNKDHLTTKQMVELAQNGVSIESHTIHHLNLDTLTAEQQNSEMKGSKELLDHMFHQNTTFLCYPAGAYNAETLTLAQSTGYKMAVTTEPGEASRDQGLYSLHRIRIFPGMTIEGFSSKLTNINNQSLF